MNDIFGDALDGIKPEGQAEDLILLQSQQDLADLLEGICEERGLSQTDLADILEMPDSEVREMMSGRKDVTLRTLARLEARLETKIFMFALARTERTGVIHQAFPMTGGDHAQAFQMGVNVGALATLASFSMTRAVAPNMPKSTLHMSHHECTTSVPLR